MQGDSQLRAVTGMEVAMKRRFLYKLYALMTAGCLVIAATGCRQTNEVIQETFAEGETTSKEGETAGTSGQETAAESIVNAEEMFTERDLDGTYEEADCRSIELGDGNVTITEEGIYLLSGTLEEGMVTVDASDSAKVQLVLNGVTISNSEGAAIYVKEADKVFITLAEGTSNILINGGSYTALDDNNIDAVIFAKSDLTINGMGSLYITAEAGHGVVSKDDLKITGGSINITAASHGLSGKDSVRIGGGSLTLTAGKDGIHSENADDTDKGFVYIADGKMNVDSKGDCISAGAYLQIDGGIFDLTAAEGAANKTVETGEDGEAVSTKGIKAVGQLIINGGSYLIDSQDDAVHSNSSLTVNDGEFSIETGDDGLHSDETTAVTGGTLEIITCYEGVEGKDVIISGGYLKITASDDGLNAAGGKDASGLGGMFGNRGGNGFGGSGGSVLISGGKIYINADGDGIDSNGTLTVTGGEIYVSGPVSAGNGALDYDGEGQITGGTVIAVGSIGMAMNFGDTSTQGSILINSVTGEAGTEIALKDAVGAVLASYTAEKSFGSVVVSCPELVPGDTYILSVGNNETEIVLDSLIYGSGSGMGGFGGGRGGFGGDKSGMGGFGGDMGGQDGRGNKQDGSRGAGPGEAPELPSGEAPEMPEGLEVPQGGDMPADGERPDMPQGGGMPEMSEGGEQPAAPQNNGN